VRLNRPKRPDQGQGMATFAYLFAATLLSLFSFLLGLLQRRTSSNASTPHATGSRAGLRQAGASE
jgi:hypothetical protein